MLKSSQVGGLKYEAFSTLNPKAHSGLAPPHWPNNTCSSSHWTTLRVFISAGRRDRESLKKVSTSPKEQEQDVAYWRAQAFRSA